MLTLLEQLDKGTLWPSHGGTHPPEMKYLSNGTPISKIPLADHYLIPIPQVGDCATLSVGVGDKVFKGQALTQGVGRQYLPVHAPTSGTVTAIEPRPSNHPSGLAINTCVIQSDGSDVETTGECQQQFISPDSLTDEEIISRVQNAGIVGMGGAEFPSHIKLSPTSDIELLIINGAECEPYLTSDDRLMREYSDKIIAGTEIIHRLLKPKRVIVVIEDNKPEAIKTMEKAVTKSNLPKGQARVTVIPTKYPSGSAKQLIKIITGQEVASGGRSSQLGILVHNVATTMAIHLAVTTNKPSIERVVSVTGKNVTKPGNYWVPIGTPVTHLLKCCGFKPDPKQMVIVGGPMMGYTLPLINVPVQKGTTAILVPSYNELSYFNEERACIRCGECAAVCPASLLPQQLFWHAKAQEYDKAASFNLRDCIECGCCSYVCPSDIPLVEYYRIAKSAIKQNAEEKVQAELAKQRFEARNKRLDAEKLAREEKTKQAAAKRQASMQTDEKDAVAAALARIQAKKAAQQVQDSNGSASTSQSNDNDPKAKVAAAVARAKAKKAALASKQDASGINKQEQNSSESSIEAPANVDDKKAKIAAAVARAKAKKAKLKSQNNTSDISDSPEVKAETDKTSSKSNSSLNADTVKTNPLKNETTDISEAPSTPTIKSEISADDKKAKIAAAVAKAKARKAAQAKQNKE